MSEVLYCVICAKKAIGKPAGCPEHGFNVASKPYIIRKPTYENLESEIADLTKQLATVTEQREEAILLCNNARDKCDTLEKQLATVTAENERLKKVSSYEIGFGDGMAEGADIVSKLSREIERLKEAARKDEIIIKMSGC